MNGDQQALIASLEEQERTLVFTRFDNADAWRPGSAVVAADDHAFVTEMIGAFPGA